MLQSKGTSSGFQVEHMVLLSVISAVSYLCMIYVGDITYLHVSDVCKCVVCCRRCITRFTNPILSRDKDGAFTLLYLVCMGDARVVVYKHMMGNWVQCTQTLGTAAVSTERGTRIFTQGTYINTFLNDTAPCFIFVHESWTVKICV